MHEEGTVTEMFASDFDFDLPDGLIAQYPVEPRDHSRLMVVERQSGRILHHRFQELPGLSRAGDILAFNDTRVIPARLVGEREVTGGKWEGLFLQELDQGLWEILSRTRGQPRPGESILIGEGSRLILQSKTQSGHWIVRPRIAGETPAQGSALGLLEQFGHIPLPPYIRKGKEEARDREWYQTVFAVQPGSVAAPTAGLHFTAAVLEDLHRKGVSRIGLTLHVGPGTFQPMRTERVSDHVMHQEWAELRAQAVSELNACRARGGRIIAVGSTSARTLETAAKTGTLAPFRGPTDLFIRPGHVFRGLDALITNFHLPRSTLLVLVSAFAGTELIREAYHEAVRLRYRFFSYGDAMLIL